MPRLDKTDYAKLALFGVMFVTCGVLVGLGRVPPEYLKMFMLLVAPSPVFSFGKKEDQK